MERKGARLRTSTLIATSILSTHTIGAAVQPSNAADVATLGALDIQIGGKLRQWVVFGDIDAKTGGNATSNYGNYDFRTDSEVFFYVRGRDEATGLEYGGNIELEADTNTTADADEAYVFIRGKFGDFRFGDQNGIVEQMVSGAQPLGVFTGADVDRPFDAEALTYGAKSEDATKVVYYSPTIAGFQLGVSYAPSRDSAGTDIRSTDSGGDLQDYIEPGITYKGAVGDINILASVTGGHARFSVPNGDDRDFYQLNSGIDLTFANVTIGAGYGFTKGARPFGTGAGDVGDANTEEAYIGGWILEAGSRQHFVNVGARATFGTTQVSLVYGQTLTSHVADGTPDSKDPEPHYGIAGIEVGIAPGLSVGSEIGYFTNNDGTSNNDGIIGLAGVKLAF